MNAAQALAWLVLGCCGIVAVLVTAGIVVHRTGIQGWMDPAGWVAHCDNCGRRIRPGIGGAWIHVRGNAAGCGFSNARPKARYDRAA